MKIELVVSTTSRFWVPHGLKVANSAFLWKKIKLDEKLWICFCFSSQICVLSLSPSLPSCFLTDSSYTGERKEQRFRMLFFLWHFHSLTCQANRQYCIQQACLNVCLFIKQFLSYHNKPKKKKKGGGVHVCTSSILLLWGIWLFLQLQVLSIWAFV